MSLEELLEHARISRAPAGEIAMPRARRLVRVGALPWSELSRALVGALDSAAKRALDLVIACALLLVFSPLLLAIAVAIRLDSPGPALFRCRRVGAGGTPFDMFKFRKMVDGAKGPPLRSSDDDRYTRLGRFLARTRLDEVPQLCNVVLGQMSLVGPRPEDPAIVRRNPRLFAEALTVRPGITGLSQLAFAKEDEILNPHDRMGHYVGRILPQKLSLDGLYVVHRTFGRDIKILLWTAAAFFVEISVHRGTGALGRRRRHGAGADQPKLTVVKSPSERPVLEGVSVVILAGGSPRERRDSGSLLPEPLMAMGDQSVLETTIEHLDDLGVERVTVCLGESAELIRAVFQYRPSEAELTFIDDTQPVGTAGPLRLVEGLDDTFLVVNGDVVTTLDYGELLRAHRASRAVMTVAAHDCRTRFDYGLLQVDGDGRLRRYSEKPEITSPASMGIYAIEPRALAFIPRRGPFDMPDLVHALIEAGLPVGVHHHDGLWYDVTRRSDYEAALAAWAAGEL